MKKISAYASFFLLLTASILLPGLLSHGQDDDDKKESREPRLQPKTEYVKMEESTTGGENQDAAGKKDGAGQQSQSESEAAKSESPTGIAGTDAGGEIPADFYMNLAAPTPREEQANLAGFIGNMPLAEAQNKIIGLRLLDSAYHYLGIPYQHNGRGDCVHGIDCSKLTRCAAIRAKLEPSSFVALAGAQYGYALKGQYNMRLISKGSLKGVQPGDFLFFNWRDAFSRARPYSIGHVALYIGPTKGNAMYLIEAGDPVQKRWGNAKYLVGVGRIIK